MSFLDLPLTPTDFVFSTFKLKKNQLQNVLYIFFSLIEINLKIFIFENNIHQETEFFKTNNFDHNVTPKKILKSLKLHKTNCVTILH